MREQFKCNSQVMPEDTKQLRLKSVRSNLWRSTQATTCPPVTSHVKMNTGLPRGNRVAKSSAAFRIRHHVKHSAHLTVHAAPLTDLQERQTMKRGGTCKVKWLERMHVH